MKVFLKHLIICGLAAAGLIAAPARASAQDIQELLTLSVSAGYDGYFRAHQWLPLRITVSNNGDALAGRLVVRPETSGDALPNTFSAPVDLPQGSTQVITLYITLRSSARAVRVELLDAQDQVLADSPVNLFFVTARDRLYAVVTQAAAGSIIDLATVSAGGYQAVQASLSLEEIPDQAAALDSVNALVFNDVDTGALTPGQRMAVSRWVLSGGHLIVTGGANWQATAAGLRDLLPLLPENSQSANRLTALARLAGDYSGSLGGQFIMATGSLIDGADVLAATPDGLPLAARRYYGNGTVDYLAADPNAQPLRSWDHLPGLWLTLLSSTNARPSWSYGFADWTRAADAVRVPGELPSALALVGFLGAYILLVGPVNYVVLNRLNRRELAWLTIPVLILAFSILARVVGFNLRGSQATLSRLTVVQSWATGDEARVDQLIGLLAPRRGDYTVNVSDDRLLRPIPVSGQFSSVLGGRQGLNADIQQTGRFAAVDFPLEDGFIAGFTATGMVPRPAISGRATLTYPQGDGLQTLQGSVRNDSDLTLTSPVILARGVAYYLDGDLAPGSVRPFSAEFLVLPGTTVPAPSPLEYAAGESDPFLSSAVFFRSSSQSYQSESRRSAIDILGAQNFQGLGLRVLPSDDPHTQEMRRRQAFLESFIIDQFASTGRGDRVYLAAWAERSPLDDEVSGASWSPVDSTLYIVELEVEVSAPPRRSVIIRQDQFTWVTLEREGATDVGPYNLSIFSESTVVFRFTPLPDAVLSEVEELTLIVERSGGVANTFFIELWNWRLEEWVQVPMQRFGRIPVANFNQFLGPRNAVQLRLHRPDFGGAVYLTQLAVEQRGTF